MIFSRWYRIYSQSGSHSKTSFRHILFPQRQQFFYLVWAKIVAQLEERLLPIPEVRGSNPVIGKMLYLFSQKRLKFIIFALLKIIETAYLFYLVASLESVLNHLLLLMMIINLKEKKMLWKTALIKWIKYSSYYWQLIHSWGNWPGQ